MNPLPDETSLTDDVELLGSELQLDSLDLATIVVQPQELTGSDPFADEFIEFRTIGELVALFEAREVGPRGITVNSVAPGYIATEMSASLDDRRLRQIVGRTPMGGWPRPRTSRRWTRSFCRSPRPS